MRYHRICSDCIFVDEIEIDGVNGWSFFCRKFNMIVSYDRHVCSKFKSLYQPTCKQLNLKFDI